MNQNFENLRKCIKKNKSYSECSLEVDQYLKNTNDPVQNKVLQVEMKKLDEIKKDPNIKDQPCENFSFLVDFCQTFSAYKSPQYIKKCSKYFYQYKQCIMKSLNDELAKEYENCWKREINTAKSLEDFKNIDLKCDITYKN